MHITLYKSGRHVSTRRRSTKDAATVLKFQVDTIDTVGGSGAEGTLDLATVKNFLKHVITRRS